MRRRRWWCRAGWSRPAGAFRLTCGSATATPSIRPSVSCSAAAIAAPAAVGDARGDHDRVVRGDDASARAPLLDACRTSRSARRTRTRTARSVSRPQSFSGFCCECACLYAQRFGNARVERGALGVGERCAVKLRVACRRRRASARVPVHARRRCWRRGRARRCRCPCRCRPRRSRASGPTRPRCRWRRRRRASRSRCAVTMHGVGDG